MWARFHRCHEPELAHNFVNTRDTKKRLDDWHDRAWIREVTFVGDIIRDRVGMMDRRYCARRKKRSAFVGRISNSQWSWTKVPEFSVRHVAPESSLTWTAGGRPRGQLTRTLESPARSTNSGTRGG